MFSWAPLLVMGPSSAGTVYRLYPPLDGAASAMSSVRLSVTLVDCDHVVQVEIDIWQDRSGVLATCMLIAEVDLDHNILSSQILLRETSWVWENVEFCMACMSHYLCMC